MGDTVNLRQFRKRKNREAEAESNRKLHGISSKQRKMTKAENAKNIANLDAHRLGEKLDNE